MSALTEGCTLISWIASWFGKRLREHGCCQEHDLFYDQGGSLWLKVWVDFKLAGCVQAVNDGSAVGIAKAILGFVVVSFNPYSYVVWYRE